MRDPVRTDLPANTGRAATRWATACLLPLALVLTGAGGDASPRPDPAARLDAAALDHFERGRAVFEQRWTVAPSAFGRWGRGPLSNGDACTDCHANAGRGTVPDVAGEPLRSAVVRLAQPDARGALQPHPAYGAQLQHLGILGRVPGEGEAFVEWTTRTVRYPDGDTVELRAPIIRLRELAHGPIGDDTRRALRIAPDLAGAGWLDAIPDDAILAAAAAPQPDGIRGRPNRVPDRATGQRVIGRFGHKAAQPDVRQQVLVALHEDLGITSRRFPEQNCTPAQRACSVEPRPSQPEIDADSEDDLVFHVQHLAPPAHATPRDPVERRGERLFADAGCAACHTPAWTIATADDATRTIHPYTDLLLHDLGPGLADGIPEFDAGASDWRTAPLWHVGRNASGALLHDGRARSPEEAILWHDGEASAARVRFMTFDRADRTALLRFLAQLR
jgi:CxxC motif-containing protein (DUF1111 family)